MDMADAQLQHQLAASTTQIVICADQQLQNSKSCFALSMAQQQMVMPGIATMQASLPHTTAKAEAFTDSDTHLQEQEEHKDLSWLQSYGIDIASASTTSSAGLYEVDQPAASAEELGWLSSSNEIDWMYSATAYDVSTLSGCLRSWASVGSTCVSDMGLVVIGTTQEPASTTA